MDYQSFVDGEKTMLIAPAGYGKTHTIAECLKYTFGKQLILTHTHAGVAALKEKIKRTGLITSRYHIETICGFAQSYVFAFYSKSDFPERDDKDFYDLIVKNATELLKLNPIIKIIKASYAGLFVDEYQDCTKIQHEMVKVLAFSLHTHLLGDPLQGIFGFDKDLVDFKTDLIDFKIFPQLSIPYRWKNNNAVALGETLATIRHDLCKEKPKIILENYKSAIELNIVKEADLFSHKRLYQIILNKDRNPDFNCLLILVPIYYEERNGIAIPKGNIEDRKKMKDRIDPAKRLKLLEAIDDRTFYSLSKSLDTLFTSLKTAKKPYKRVFEFLEKLFHQTDINDWFNENSVKIKREPNVEKSEYLSEQINTFIKNPTIVNFDSLLHYLKNVLNFTTGRPEILDSLFKAIKISKSENINIYNAMIKQRNIIRAFGRKIQGKCIGTTLLTKGLEFDTVVLLNAHRFECPKHLYVAMTRCCKRLIVFTENVILLEKCH